MPKVLRFLPTLALLLSLTAAPLYAQEDPSPPETVETDQSMPSTTDVDTDQPTDAPVATPIPTAMPVPTPEVTAAPSIESAIAAAQPSVVHVRTDIGAGSGVKIADGILTAAHVVKDTSSIQIYTADHRHAPATIARIDPGADIALLKTDLDLPALDLEPVAGQHVGDVIAAIGYPGDADDAGPSSIARGQLSSTGTGVQGRSLLEITAPLEHGYSGGPVINIRGHVIGLGTFGERVEADLKTNYAVGSDTAYAFLALPQSQVAPRPMKLFTGDPRSVSLPQAYLGTGWVLDNEDTSDLAQGGYSARYHLDAPDGRIVVSVGTLVTSSPAAAALELPASVKTIDQQLNWLGVPNFGDDAGAWLSQSGQTAVVAARAANVVVFAAEQRPYPLTRDNIVGSGSVSDMAHYMCDRVVSQVK